MTLQNRVAPQLWGLKDTGVRKATAINYIAEQREKRNRS